MRNKTVRTPRNSTREIMLCMRNMSVYMRSGIPLLESLDLAQTESRAGMSRVLSLISEEISRGVTLSKALLQFPASFPALYVHIISAGELSGSLPASLSRVAAMLERRIEIRQKIGSAAMYPLIILFGTIVVSFVLIFFAFPKIVPLLVGLNVSLPRSTRLVLWVSSVFSDHLLLVLLLCGLIGSSLWYASKSKTVQVLIQESALHMPVLKKVIQSYVLGMQFRTLATLLQSGMRLDAAIAHLIQTTSFAPYKRSLAAIDHAVTTGATCSSGMVKFPHAYPPLSIQLVLVGERTGTLAQSLDMLADIYEQEFTQKIAILSSLLEPVLLLILGVVVGTVAMAIISPMYGLTQQLTTQ